MAVGFGTSFDGSWLSVDRSDWGGFRTNALQAYLLDYFTVDGVPVDPYDGGRFCDEQLNVLIRQLETAVKEVSAQPPDWPFLDERERGRYFETCRSYGIEPLLPRDQALHVLHDAARLAVKAREQGEFLIFCGD